MTGYTDGFAATGTTRKFHYRMLRIIDRYILRELTMNVVAVAVVLLVVVAGGTFARVLQQVAQGSYPASVMFDVLGLKMLSAMAGILPLALFLGILMGLGRLYHDSEMHVLAASGMGRRGLVRPAAWLGIPTAIVVGLLSLWLGPWADHKADTMITEANHSVIAAGLEPGRFTELPGRGGTLFVSGMNRDGTRLSKVFVVREDEGDGKSSPTLKVVTADQGRLYADSDGQGRYLALTDGWQFELPLGADNWSRMQYRENDMALSEASPGTDDAEGSATSTWALWKADDPPSRAELAWRMAAPVATLVLVLLALPLSRQSPREPRYGRMMIAVLSYFVYFSVLSLARSMISQDQLHNDLPVWLLHLVVAAISVWVFWRQYAPRKVRRARA